jgi:glutamine amidotransferase
MCRHVAYLGSAGAPPVALQEVLCDPPHGLLRQSWAPRRQRNGTVNADGFGVGWYAENDPIPARYRSASPMWADPTFRDLARVIRARVFLAAVRDGTLGMPYGAATAAPFADRQYLFSHNGAVPGWPESMAEVAGRLAPEMLLTLEAPTDSALLWALIRDRLAGGVAIADALTAVVLLAASTAGGRLNLLVTDGSQVLATAYGDTLCWRADAAGLVVASEPYDDEPGWQDVPDKSLLVGTPDGVTVSPLPLPPDLP